MKRRAIALPAHVALVVSLAACDAPVEDPAAIEAAAPLTGVDGSVDSADRDCHVVLRELVRPAGETGGFVERDGVWVWRGVVEVSAAAVAEGAVPAALYQYGSDPTWWETPASAIGDAPAGDDPVRFAIELDRGLPGPGMSGSALASARVQVVPFLHLPDGGRLFDHNRRAGDLDAYVLDAAGGFAIADDPATCAAPTPPSTTIAFADDWSERQDGAIVAGGALVVDYDLDRLTACRGTHNGHPAWDLEAVVRFLPGGQEARASVRTFETVLGYPTNAAHPTPARFEVPADARGVDVWFENRGLAPCLGYDSNDGLNYRFAVAPPPAWVGDAVVLLTRDTASTCDGGAPLADGFAYDTWVRQRAAIRNVCLAAWSPGVTDRGDPEVWRALDVAARYRFADGPFAEAAVAFDAAIGDDARFAWDLRAVDPFRWGACPSVPTELSADGQQRVATLEYYLTVNGVELRPSGRGSLFRGRFSDAVGGAAPCP